MDYSKLLEQKQKELKGNKSTGFNNKKPVVVSIKKDPNKKVDLVGTKLVLSFPYNIETVMKIKNINGRKYDKETKCWTIKCSLVSIQKLEELGFTFTDKVEKEYKKYLSKLDYNDNSDLKEIDIKTPKGLSLRDYQKKTIDFIYKRKGKAIISLEQGLGKTIVVASYINNNPDIKPIIIVCPSSLKYNWQNELNKWAPKRKIEILEGRKSKKLKKTTDIIIINYDILTDWVKELKLIKPDLVVFDEAHYIKAVNSVKRVKAAKSLSNSAKQILPLTGTPVINNLNRYLEYN